MHKSPSIAQALAEYLSNQTKATHFCVAYSGGMDSHVLLHAFSAALEAHPNLSLRAVYVDHGLQADSQRWAAHCKTNCDELGIPMQVLPVTVDDAGGGPEANARLARYAAFSDNLLDGEQLLLAQHADDQAETFLLQALRGSGPDGLASIPRKRTFANGYLCRPLLPCSQQQLAEYAANNLLDWIEDPTNKDTAFDRNYLRNVVMPLNVAPLPAKRYSVLRWRI